MTKITAITIAWIFLFQITAATAGAYTLGTQVGDMRQTSSISGGTSCPQLTRFDVSTPGAINRQWSTSLGTSPVTILTVDQTPAGQLNEIESVIQQSLAAWTGVSGTSLTPSSLGTLQRTASASACSSSDGLNSICLNQDDPGFAIGVLAFTRVVSADVAGEQLSAATPPSTFVGEILDADVLLRPGDTTTTFATPAVPPEQPELIRPGIDSHARAWPFVWLRSLGGMEVDNVSLRASSGAIHRSAAHERVTRCAAIRGRSRGVTRVVSEPERLGACGHD